MRRTVGGALALLVLLPAARALDEPKPAGTPAEQYKALVKKYDDARQEFFKAYAAAKTDEERQKLFNAKYPKASDYAKPMLELADKHPKDPAALEALIWLCTEARGTPEQPKALDRLERDHVRSDKIARVCQMLAYDLPSARNEPSCIMTIRSE